MSWSAFKSTMTGVMSNWTYGRSMEGWAAALTMAYDTAIKAGKTNVTSIPLQQGQNSAMQGLLISELHTQQQSKTKTLIDICGPAIIAYWTGAKIMPIPPGIPCPGTIANVSVIIAPVTNPGSWSPIPNLPCNNVSIWLDEFITCAKAHLLTTSGIHTEISLYPGVPPVPAPCVQSWSGYTVPG